MASVIVFVNLPGMIEGDPVDTGGAMKALALGGAALMISTMSKHQTQSA
jgi:hypothetical protein